MRKLLVLGVLAVLAMPLVAQPNVGLESKLIGSSTVASNQLGRSVAISGDTALVGSYANKANVFVRDGWSWVQQQEITVAGSSGKLGSQVALQGNTALVSDHLSGAGLVHVFERTGTTWTKVQTLSASNGATGDQFGSSLAFDGTSLLVGATDTTHSGHSNAGTVYIFTKVGGSWTEQQQLIASNAGVTYNFGSKIALNGSNAVVEASGYNRVYFFQSSGSSWAELQILQGASGSGFGKSLSIDGATALIGHASGADFYTLVATTWTLQSQLSSSSSGFGAAVALRGGNACVGDSTANAANVYQYSAGNWNLVVKLVASDAMAGDSFGLSVACTSGVVVVGAPLDDHAGGVNAGSAYVYELQDDFAEIVVRRDEDVSNNTTDTVYGGVAGVSLSVTYTIENEGAEDLGVLVPISVSGFSNCNGAVTSQPTGTVQAYGGTTQFTIDCTPTAQGSFSLGVQLKTSDPDERLFAFTVAGVAAATAAPQIVVLRPSGAVVTSGGLESMPAKLPIGTASSVDYLVENRGGAPLVLSAAPQVKNCVNCGAAAASVTGSTVPPGGRETLTVQFTAAASGVVSFRVEISSNDTTANPFVFDVAGIAVGLERHWVSLFGSQGSLTSSGEWAAYVRTNMTLPQVVTLHFNGAVWFEHSALTPFDCVSTDQVSSPVIAGTTLVFGVPNKDSNYGAVYIYDLVNGQWRFAQKLRGKFSFGQALALDGNTLAVGSPGGKGNVDIYVRAAGTWSHTTTLQPTDLSNQDYFGGSLGLQGSLLVVGATGQDSGGISDSGAAYVFQVSGGSWSQIGKLTSTTPEVGGGFGTPAATDGSYVAVGSLETSQGIYQGGSVHVYALVGGGLQHVTRLDADATYQARFFRRPRFFAGKLFVGSSQALHRPTSSGEGQLFCYQYSSSSVGLLYSFAPRLLNISPPSSLGTCEAYACTSAGVLFQVRSASNGTAVLFAPWPVPGAPGLLQNYSYGGQYLFASDDVLDLTPGLIGQPGSSRDLGLDVGTVTGQIEVSGPAQLEFSYAGSAYSNPLGFAASYASWGSPYVKVRVAASAASVTFTGQISVACPSLGLATTKEFKITPTVASVAAPSPEVPLGNAGELYDSLADPPINKVTSRRHFCVWGPDNRLVVGVNDYSIGSPAFVYKFSNSGTVAWSRSFSTRQINDMALDSQGNIVLCGHRWFVGSSDYEPWLLKLDANGNTLWERIRITTTSYNNEGTWEELAVGATDEIGVIGRAPTQTNPQEVLRSVYDEIGNSIGGSSLAAETSFASDQLHIAPTNPEWTAYQWFIGGIQKNTLEGPLGVFDLGSKKAQQVFVSSTGQVLVVTNSGILIFDQQLRPLGFSNDISQAGLISSDVASDGIFVCSKFSRLTKYASGGRLQWTTLYYGPGGENIVPVAVESDGGGGAFVFGHLANSYNLDLIMLHFDANGYMTHRSAFNGPQNAFDYALDMRRSGSVVAAVYLVDVPNTLTQGGEYRLGLFDVSSALPPGSGGAGSGSGGGSGVSGGCSTGGERSAWFAIMLVVCVLSVAQRALAVRTWHPAPAADKPVGQKNRCYAILISVMFLLSGCTSIAVGKPSVHNAPALRDQKQYELQPLAFSFSKVTVDTSDRTRVDQSIKEWKREWAQLFEKTIAEKSSKTTTLARKDAQSGKYAVLVDVQHLSTGGSQIDAHLRATVKVTNNDTGELQYKSNWTINGPCRSWPFPTVGSRMKECVRLLAMHVAELISDGQVK